MQVGGGIKKLDKKVVVCQFMHLGQRLCGCVAGSLVWGCSVPGLRTSCHESVKHCKRSSRVLGLRGQGIKVSMLWHHAELADFCAAHNYALFHSSDAHALKQEHWAELVAEG